MLSTLRAVTFLKKSETLEENVCSLEDISPKSSNLSFLGAFKSLSVSNSLTAFVKAVSDICEHISKNDLVVDKAMRPLVVPVKSFSPNILARPPTFGNSLIPSKAVKYRCAFVKAWSSI